MASIEELNSEKGIGTENRKAIIIGTSSYQNLEHTPQSKNDAEEIYERLISQGYQISDNHYLVGDVQWEKMRDGIIDFFTAKSVASDDLLVFYFSGAAIPDDYGEIYFATSEIDPDNPVHRGLAFEEVAKVASRSKSKRIIAILDCPFSGAFRLGENGSVLASSKAYQESFASAEHGHGIFTYHLLEALKGRDDAVDNGGNVTPASLGWYIYNKMANFSQAYNKLKQVPLARVEIGTDIVLANYPELVKGPELWKLLKNGKIQDFNKIREDLRIIDLHRINLRGADLRGADLHMADLMESVLSQADLSQADLRGADLRGADLTKSNLSGSNLAGADARSAYMSLANLSEATISGAIMTRVELNGANLQNAQLVAYLVLASLEGADLRSAYLDGANFRWANLSRANLSKTDLKGANFSVSILREADMRGALNVPFSKEECESQGVLI